MPESLRAKALRAIAEDRVRVIKANNRGIALEVIASKPDPATLTRATYRALVYAGQDSIVRSCGCPAVKRCYHLEAAELLWQPEPRDRSP